MRIFLIALLISCSSLHTMQQDTTSNELTDVYFSSSSSQSAQESSDLESPPPSYPEIFIHSAPSSEGEALSTTSSSEYSPPQLSNSQASQSHRRIYRKKRIAAALAIIALGIVGESAPFWTEPALNTMNEIGSPITAYPATFNCIVEQQKCTPIFPIVARKPNCTYTEFHTTRSFDCPGGYTKGTCLLQKNAGCACLVEECEGAEEYKKAYKTACGGKWIIAINLTVATMISTAVAFVAIAPYTE